MYDIREELMQKMVGELKKVSTHFEIMSDEEFYNSEYGERRRQRNQTCSNVVYMHCLVPGIGRNLLGVYFHKKDIAIAAPVDYEEFSTDIDVDIATKDVYKNPYLSFRVSRNDHDEMFSDSKKMIIEMLRFGEKKELYRP